MLAFITGTVDQELLLRNEYLASENRILRAQIKGRLLLSDTEKKTLAEIVYRLGRKALETVANAAKLDTTVHPEDAPHALCVDMLSSVGYAEWRVEGLTQFTPGRSYVFAVHVKNRTERSPHLQVYAFGGGAPLHKDRPGITGRYHYVLVTVSGDTVTHRPYFLDEGA